MKKVVLVVSAVSWLLACSFMPGAVYCHELPDEIKFGIFPYKSPRSIVSLFLPIVKRLEAELDIKVRLVTAPDFQTYIDRGNQGEFDLALPCVTCFFQIQEAGYTVIARGAPSFHGGVFVRRDSGIESIEQLKGRKIAAIGRHSYAGYLFLVDQLMEKGIDPEKGVDFQFLGKADTVVYGVINRKYDAGTIRSDILENPAFREFEKDIKFISFSYPIPQFPFVVKKELPTGLTNEIRQVLTSFSIDNEDDRKVMESLHIKRIIPAFDSDYDQILRRVQMIQEFSR